MSTFRRVVIQLEVLTEDPTLIFDDMSLEDIYYEILDGGCSGHIEILSNKKVSGKEMAKLAEAQGTDPGFFGIDHNGRSIEQ